MSSVKRVAVAGATGYVGYPIVKALLEAGVFDILALVRASSVRAWFLSRPILTDVMRSQLNKPQIKALESQGVQVHGVSYDDEAQLSALLRGVDVVISTLAYASVDSQVQHC
jgi:uncharacterized protein YbjT (DUF2867 family)